MKRIVYPLIVCFGLLFGLTLLSYDILSPVAEEEDALLDYKAVDFIKPIDLPFKLSGNFGEIRTNHFHSGLDIKTNGEIGYPVYSIGDGYVSRIKISSYGYGKAIYITHPNGFTSVYAHLNEITGEAGKYLKSQQYNRKKFSVDLYPSKDMIKIRQGQVVAKSGNSGGSGGPHLHFEIRETASSKPINPLKFNYALPDSISPLIESVSFYAINDNSGIVASNTFKAAKKLTLPVKKVNGVYRVDIQHPIKIKGRIGFGVETFDRASLAPNTLGVYSIDTYVDGKRISYFKSDKFSFKESRYVNSLIDFEEKYNHNKVISRTYRLPGNKLSLYKDMQDKGIYNFGDEKDEKDIVIVVKDIANNTSVLKFKVQVSEEFFLFDRDHAVDKEMYFYNTINELEKSDIYAKFPKYSFYKSFFFKHENIEPNDKQACYSPIHKLDEPSVPVHRYYELKIKPTKYEERLKDKYLIASIDKDGNFESEGGTFIDGFVYTKTRVLGKFTVVVDSIAPIIKPVNVYEGKNVRGQRYIDFEVIDDFTGIDYFEGTLDDQWILLDYDAKKNRLRYIIDEYLTPGQHQIRIVTSDEKGNESYIKLQIVS